MRCTVLSNETCQYPCNFICISVIVQSTTYPKISILTLILFEKSNVSGHYKTITADTPFISKMKRVPTYRHLMLNYRPLINRKPIEQIEINSYTRMYVLLKLLAFI